MSDETRDEICNTINYGSRAWRLIRIRQLLSERRRQLLSEGKGLRPEYLSAGWAEIGRQVEERAAAAQRFRAKNKGKLPTPEEFLKLCDQFEAASLWRERIVPPPRPRPVEEAAVLWRQLMQHFETALVIGDDDFLNDLAKAIRGEAQPEPNAEFTTKVLVLLQKKTGAELAEWLAESERAKKNERGPKPSPLPFRSCLMARDIFADEDLKKDYLDKMPNGRPDLKGRLKVEGRRFENKQRALDAIHDIAKKVKHELARS